MHGKYFDRRVHTHFVTTYSRVPYLDTEIFNIETNALRESHRATNRVAEATDAIQRTLQKSELLTKSLAESRVNRQREARQFLTEMQVSQEHCLAKQRESWKDYEREKSASHSSRIRDQQYLDGLLKSNSTKAESRLSSVRRWG